MSWVDYGLWLMVSRVGDEPGIRWVRQVTSRADNELGCFRGQGLVRGVALERCRSGFQEGQRGLGCKLGKVEEGVLLVEAISIPSRP